MKKIILTFMICAISSVTFANDANNNTELKEKTEKAITIKKSDEDRLKKVTIKVDCDGDGSWDMYYSGHLDESNTQSMVDYMVSMC